MPAGELEKLFLNGGRSARLGFPNGLDDRPFGLGKFHSWLGHAPIFSTIVNDVKRIIYNCKSYSTAIKRTNFRDTEIAKVFSSAPNRGRPALICHTRPGGSSICTGCRCPNYATEHFLDSRVLSPPERLLLLTI